MLSAAALAAVPAADERDSLAEMWAGSYDISEELITGDAELSPLAPLTEQQRVQINVRRVQLPWLGSHVLYAEEYPYDEPFELRRRVLLSIERDPSEIGLLRVRQFTRKPAKEENEKLSAGDIESLAGCDIFLKRDGVQFRGGTRGRHCLETVKDSKRWLDYRVVVGDGLYWYRKRKLTLEDDELAEEIAGFPHVDLEDARLFSCGIRWAPPGGRVARRSLPSVDLHDRGGRARFNTPDGRELKLELHGRDWPLSAGRESLVIILRDARNDSDAIASSWTSLGAARVGIDIGWLAVDCAPVVSETGETRS